MAGVILNRSWHSLLPADGNGSARLSCSTTTATRCSSSPQGPELSPRRRGCGGREPAVRGDLGDLREALSRTFAANLLPTGSIPKGEAPDHPGNTEKDQGPPMVGATGFEPATTCTPSKCATRLRYAPARNCGGSVVASAPGDVNGKGELLRAVERVLQHLRRAERQHLARADLDLLAGLRI